MPASENSSTKSFKSRSSLACLPCRSRHLKCDAKKPICSRCMEAENVECSYAKSRRGGLDRAALAERRKKIAATRSSPSNHGQRHSLGSSDFSEDPGDGRQPAQTQEDIALLPDSNAATDIDLIFGLAENLMPPTPPADIGDIEQDSLVTSYFNNFHRFHPLVLPRRYLSSFYRKPSNQSRLSPLLAVLRFIGYLYSHQQWSTSHVALIEEALSQAIPSDPFIVQARLLYSICLFWNGYEDASQLQMDIAVQVGIELSLHLEEYAIEHGSGDPILTESWRRTWWMLYVLDEYYAGTLGTKKFRVGHVEPTTGLPCEEAEYERGEIPQPKTLEDFDSREFAPEGETFSSFAYLIGIGRAAVSATMIARDAKENDAATAIITEAGSIIKGWILLLPKDMKPVMKKSGEIDELMFQATLLAHVALIGLHRPFSDLKFSPIEEISSCARDSHRKPSISGSIDIHTVQVLRSVESQIRLLALPVSKFSHSPFVTCMISEGTLSLLSACSYLFTGKKLNVARDQIRMTLGCLKSLADIWPRTATNVQQIQTIARRVLGLERTAIKNNQIASSTASRESVDSTNLELDFNVLDSNGLAAFGGDLNGQLFDSLNRELSWWMNE